MKTLAIINDFIAPPWGGGNQFLLGLKHQLEMLGCQVITPFMLTGRRLPDYLIKILNRLRGYRFCHRADAVLFNSFNFDPVFLAQVAAMQKRMVHRVDGPIDVYRGEDQGIDRKILAFNQQFANLTIFQSQYSFRKHLELGLKFENPIIIPNAPNPEFFFAPSLLPGKGTGKTRLIASSWSTNPKKGAATLQWLDRNLDWQRYEMTFVGRCPCEFENITAIGAVGSRKLGKILRQHDIYLAPSQDDPCSNALLEALACGLPAIYHNSGGHPELVQKAGLAFSSPHEIPELLEQMVAHHGQFKDHIKLATLGEVAKAYHQAIFPSSCR